MRQVVLDTETTGLSTSEGHRVIEIGCVELINRRVTGRDYHRYLNPERSIDEGAERVHGISIEDLVNQPRFADVATEFLEFIAGAELIIHNAEFDVGFLEYELQLMKHPQPEIRDHAAVVDTLQLARQMHPGQRNSLDALCKRYGVDASNRDLHGALIDADLLARVYLSMTGGQETLSLDAGKDHGRQALASSAVEARPEGLNLVIVSASTDEISLHESMLDRMAGEGGCVWRDGDSDDTHGLQKTAESQ